MTWLTPLQYDNPSLTGGNTVKTVWKFSCFLWPFMICFPGVIPAIASGQPDDRVRQAEENRIATLAKASRAAICIFSTDANEGGSGVIISPDGYAITNFHVADPCGIHLHCGLYDSDNQTSQLYNAVIVGMDPVGDLAMIKLIGRNDFPVAKLGDSDKVFAGQSCFAVGNPFLLANDFQPSVSSGIISGTGRYQYPAGTLLEYPDCLQTDAAINPGNSGGPLFSSAGILIGINGRGSFEKRGRVNVGVGYAISVNQVRNFIGSLRSGRLLDHATLDAVVATSEDQSVRVSQISQQSDAYRKGIRYDDELLSVGGRKITSTNDVKNILGTFPSHWSVPIVFRNEETTREAFVRLRAIHSEEDLLKKLAKRPEGEKPGNPPDKVPDVIAKQYQTRRGFANYHFNQLHRDRLLKKLILNRDLTKGPSLSMTGTTGLDSFHFIVKGSQAGLKIGEEAFTVSSDSPLENQTVPRKSGGLLNLMFLWRKLISGEHSGMGISYLGDAPFFDPSQVNITKQWKNKDLYDVLRVLVDGTETLFYLDDSARVIAAEYFPFPESDPCIVRFQDYRAVKPDLELPHQIQVFHRQKTYLQMKNAKYSLTAASPEKN